MPLRKIRKISPKFEISAGRRFARDLLMQTLLVASVLSIFGGHAYGANENPTIPSRKFTTPSGTIMIPSTNVAVPSTNRSVPSTNIAPPSTYSPYVGQTPPNVVIDSQLQGAVTADDLLLNQRVIQELQSSIPNFNSQEIRVNSRNGQVLLEGTVRSQIDADRIVNRAKMISGVTGVASRITVK